MYFEDSENFKALGALWLRLRSLLYGVYTAAFLTVDFGMIQHIGGI